MARFFRRGQSYEKLDSLQLTAYSSITIREDNEGARWTILENRTLTILSLFLFGHRCELGPHNFANDFSLRFCPTLNLTLTLYTPFPDPNPNDDDK